MYVLGRHEQTGLAEHSAELCKESKGQQGQWDLNHHIAISHFRYTTPTMLPGQ